MISTRTFFAEANTGSLSPQEEERGEVCIANISPYERRKRLNFAIQQLIVTLLILGVLIVLGLHPLWRLPLFFLFSASMVSFFQSRDKT